MYVGVLILEGWVVGRDVDGYIVDGYIAQWVGRVILFVL